MFSALVHVPNPWRRQIIEALMSRTVPSELGALYDDALIAARATARTHGYALAVHGSQMRDLDLIAVPWVEAPSDPEMLATAIRDAVHGAFTSGDPQKKPHGRLAWAIHLNHPTRLGDALAALKVPFAPFIDLSVMPVGASLSEETPGVEGDNRDG